MRIVFFSEEEVFLMCTKRIREQENVEDDFYRFDEQNYQLVGDRFHKVYRLGQHITVMVLSVDKLLKTVDFLPFKR